MSDRHTRILLMAARRSQRRLDAEPAPSGSTQERDNLVEAARMTRRRFTLARIRRDKSPD